MTQDISRWEHRNNVRYVQKASTASIQHRAVNSAHLELTAMLDQRTVRRVRQAISAQALWVNTLQTRCYFTHLCKTCHVTRIVS